MEEASYIQHPQENFPETWGGMLCRAENTGSGQRQGPGLPSFSWPIAGMVWKIQFT